MNFLFVLLLFLAGLFTTFISYSLIRKGLNAAKWPSVKGRIVLSDTKTVQTVNLVNVAKIRLKYTYSVNGEAFEGTKIDFLPSRQAALLQQLKLMNFREGKEVDVFYNPLKPSQAILSPGIKFKYFGMGLLGLAAWAFAVLGICIMFGN